MGKNTDIHEISDGDIHIWINEGGGITIKAVDRYNSPVELSEDEALEVATVLQKLVAKLRD